jgi:hypothetical protein
MRMSIIRIRTILNRSNRKVAGALRSQAWRQAMLRRIAFRTAYPIRSHGSRNGRGTASMMRRQRQNWAGLAFSTRYVRTIKIAANDPLAYTSVNQRWMGALDILSVFIGPHINRPVIRIEFRSDLQRGHADGRQRIAHIVKFDLQVATDVQWLF